MDNNDNEEDVINYDIDYEYLDQLAKEKEQAEKEKAEKAEIEKNNVDEPIVPYEKFSNTKRTLVKLRPVLLILAILCFIKAGLFVYHYNMAKLPDSHVYVCDNPNYRSDFDLWIKDDIGVTWVPSYVIINDGYVIGAFDGAIDVDDFSDKLATALSFNLPFVEVPNIAIENINGERISAKKLFGSGTYILEVSWVDCKDCKYQDEHFTDDIYERFSTKNIYRYYIMSEKSKVIDKYK